MRYPKDLSWASCLMFILTAHLVANPTVVFKEDWDSGVINSSLWDVRVGQSAEGSKCRLEKIGPDDWAIFTEGGTVPSDHTTVFCAKPTFRRTGNLRCTFRAWIDPAKIDNWTGGDPTSSQIGGPWHSGFVGVSNGMVVAGPEASIRHWEKPVFAQAGDAWPEGGHRMSEEFVHSFRATTSKVDALSIRVWLGDHQGAMLEWSRDGENWINEQDTRGKNGGRGEHVFLGFATFSAGVFIDDIRVEANDIPRMSPPITPPVADLLPSEAYKMLPGADRRPCPIDADIWVLAGQSNMMPSGAVGQPVILDPRRVMNFRLSNRWTSPEEPLAIYHESVNPIRKIIHVGAGGDPEKFDRLSRTGVKRVAGHVGVGTGFAKRIIDHIDVNVGLVPCAHGGMYMFQWDPQLKYRGGASLYGSMMKRIVATGGKVRGILWYQGENETRDYYADGYEAALLDLVDSFRRDMGDPDLPFIYVQLGRFYLVPPENFAAWEKIREIQRRVCFLRENVHFVSAIDLPLSDGLHLSAEGAQRLGWRLAEVALSEVYNLSGHGRSINLETVRYLKEERVIKLHFSGVTGWLRASGRPADFHLRVEDHHTYSPVSFRTDFDPDDPAGLILRLGGRIEEPFRLIYGSGPIPYCNIVDERDIPIPAFGPIEIPED